jgi:hypothetical protein
MTSRVVPIRSLQDDRQTRFCSVVDILLVLLNQVNGELVPVWYHVIVGW